MFFCSPVSLIGKHHSHLHISLKFCYSTGVLLIMKEVRYYFQVTPSCLLLYLTLCLYYNNEPVTVKILEAFMIDVNECQN